MSKIKGLISPEEAKALDAQYTERYDLTSRYITTRPDNRSNWFSIEDLEKYIAHAKDQAKNKFKVELSGIRIYNGAHKSEDGKGGYSTVFLIPTSENNLGKDCGLGFFDPSHAPVLADWAERPPKQGEKLSAKIANSKTHLLQDCGHMMMLEKSYQTLQALKVHLSST